MSIVHQVPMSGEQTERVFISYSHDSDSHSKRVLDLANQLRREGVDAWIDQYEPNPAEGWPRWMQNQLKTAAFVLAVCTETYRRRFEGEEKPGQGLGVTWEGLLATQMLCQTGGRNDRVVPVVFDGGDSVVPENLQPYTRYRLPGEYDALYRLLTNQPKIAAPPLGPRRKLATERGFQVDFAVDTASLPRRTPLPAIPTSSRGLPDPAKVESPFIVGPPIEKPEHFFGRQRELDEIRHALAQPQAVQLVGEARMGKTSLLNRVRDLLPSDRPVARINAQGLAGHSPKDLLLAIATAFNRRPEIEHRVGDQRADSLLVALEQLMPCAVLLDEADALAEPGHGFDKHFFDECRTLCQDHRLIWVSASHAELGALFKQSGLTSRFLNDSKIVPVGQLDPSAADALVEVLGPVLADQSRKLAGGFAMGLQWLGHELLRQSHQPLLAENFANAMGGIFANWWDGLGSEERKLLKRACAGVALSSLGDSERRKLAAMVQRGLAEQEDGTFRVPGAAWRGFVGDAG